MRWALFKLELRWPNPIGYRVETYKQVREQPCWLLKKVGQANILFYKAPKHFRYDNLNLDGKASIFYSVNFFEQTHILLCN